jgi:hypothetical protein
VCQELLCEWDSVLVVLVLDQQKQLNQRLNLPNILNLLTYHLLTFQLLLGLKLEGMRSGIAMALEQDQNIDPKHHYLYYEHLLDPHLDLDKNRWASLSINRIHICCTDYWFWIYILL